MNQAGGQRAWHILVADVAEAETMCKDSAVWEEEALLKPTIMVLLNQVKTFELTPEACREGLLQESEFIIFGQWPPVAIIY